MVMRWLAVAGLWAAIAGSVWAADPKAEAKPVAPEVEAAMERARKQAANPLRVILEASRLRRKAGTEAESAPAPTKPARAETVLAGRPEGSGAAAADSARPVPLPTPPAAAMPVPMPASAETAREAQPVEAAPTAPPPAPLASLPPVAAATPLSESLGAPLSASISAPVTAPAAAKPRLREMVEPVIPPRVLDEVGKLGAIEADLLIRADGSVAQVTLIQPVPRQLARLVVSAMERWRFEPLAAEARHRVQLVFNDER